MRGERTVVCKHWMRHLCKKGDDCEFLHEYEMSKMPVCYFFQRFGECTNKDCQYLHVDAETLKIRDCAWYDRGFCKHGRIPSPLSLSLLCFSLLTEICIVQVQVVGTDTLDVCCARITSVGSAPTDRNASTISESPSAPCRVGVGVSLSCCMLVTHDSGREKGAHSL
ncbi:Cleavage and polyadenylation specificity factor subunit 4 [Geodia barretti]|uniref:Cleavage and polyadenylation specificity factor subunit 4 n=1 Tax=Geodia barretti TaxID=519541 RepID=A0AA35T3S7_GEOBA|nr:Cleavage and polyadenylation specificity factor subunit 4 [Geodia barretti]